MNYQEINGVDSNTNNQLYVDSAICYVNKKHKPSARFLSTDQCQQRTHDYQSGDEDTCGTHDYQSGDGDTRMVHTTTSQVTETHVWYTRLPVR